MDLNTVLDWARQKIGSSSDSAALDAELLLAHCIGKSRSYLYTWPEQALSDEHWETYQSLIAQRLIPTPVAYLLGEREFFSLDFKTTPAALIPRSDTELLVEAALKLCPNHSNFSILELGTGTGAIAITLKLHRPSYTVIATDISPQCLELAKQNATRHEVDINWRLSDWFNAVETSERYDMIVSNPPYIAQNDVYLTRGDLPAEPLLALSSGPTGLESLQHIITSALDYLKPGGHLLLEHGYDQEFAVANLLKSGGFTNISCQYDINNLPRLSIGQCVSTESHQVTHC
ncbi:MAG: release factor glutamine methyltransferase [Candidatus Azotimanducaceae bacterium]|jgi:release factor glutamine methyltransferase